MTDLIFGFWMICVAGLLSGFSGMLGEPSLGWLALGFGLVGWYGIVRGIRAVSRGRE